VDAVAFEGLVQASAQVTHEEAEDLLRRAEALWRGPAFTSYDDLPGVREAAARLTELRLAARERRAHVLVELGRYDEAVADLESLVLTDPLREVAVVELVTALARTGRAAEALGRLADLRAELRESGLDPSARIEVLQQRVLAGDLGPRPDDSFGSKPLALVCRQFLRAPGEMVMLGEAGSGPTLVLVPGWVSRLDAVTTGLDPRGRVLALLARDLRVVTYDRFGTGLSPGTVDSFDLETSVAELTALLEEFHIERLRKTPSIALSGGERRRVEIARSLAAKPRLILLDEPFAGVDPISVGEIQKIVRHLKQRGIGVLITDHNVRETLGICDRAYILNAGSVLAQGSPEAVLANPDVRRVYLGESFRL